MTATDIRLIRVTDETTRDACEVDGCFRPRHAKGLCSMHYQRRKRGIDLGPAGELQVRGLCTQPDCDRPHNAKGLCSTHYKATRRPTRRLVSKAAYIEARIQRVESGCWEWQLTPSSSTGYGKASWNGGRDMAHRFTYKEFVGPIPEGLHLDHLCRNRMCVNPGHLEPVTPAENVRRGFSPMMLVHFTGCCSRGHVMAGDNLYESPRGARACRTCARKARAARYLRERAA